MPSILDVYREYGVSYTTERDQWVNTKCCHCSDHGQHLGFNISRTYYTCWRCGWHDVPSTLSKLLGVDLHHAREIYNSIRGAPDAAAQARRDRLAQAKVRIKGYRRPAGVIPLQRPHARYLERRGFDPDKIVAEWDIWSTSPLSFLDNIDYRYRLFIPIMWEGQEVSFQTRDFTGKAKQRYMACPIEREIEHHKHILYGNEAGWKDRLGIAVEGVTDCWRLGSLAFGVFGVQYKLEQLAQIDRKFDRVAIVFDSERDAQRQARRLWSQLRGMSVDATVIDLGDDKDPGSLSEDDAAHLIRDVRKWGRQVQVAGAQ